MKVKALMAVLLLVGMASTGAAFEGGTGSSSDPYEIATCQQLQDIQNDLSASYELISDVDCSSFTGFSSVGDSSNNFTGVLDGQGYVVENLTIDEGSSNYAGLIGYMGTGSEVKNIGVVNVDITGDNFVGGLVGRDVGGSVSNSYSTGSISLSGSLVGGLVGYNEGSVSNSYSRASVSADNDVGGLVGRDSGSVSNSYSTGSVSGDDDVGGLVGADVSGSVSNSYSTGSVSGNDDVGGLVGHNVSGSVSDSYWDTESSGQSTSNGGTGLTTNEMTYPNAESNMAFDFSSVWTTCSINAGNDQYPYQQVFEGISFTCNQPPSFDFVNVSPDPPLIGVNASYSLDNASDPDGTIVSGELTVYKDGSQVYQDTQSFSSSSISYTWSDVYVPQSEGDLDARFTVTDDAGATSTQWLNRSLTDSAASVDISSPGNQTYFSYDRTLQVDTGGGDSVPDEELSCTSDLDGQEFDSRTVTEGETFSTGFDAGLGSHTVSVSCTDPQGHTNTTSVDFTTKAYRQDNLFASDKIYETETGTYEADLTTGSMVDNVYFELYYDGVKVNETDKDSSGVGSLAANLEHTVGLVSSNQTTENWRIDYTVNYTTVDGVQQTISDSTGQQTQHVLWSYYIESHDTVPADGDYIEREDLEHEVVMHTETKKADLEGVTTYTRDSATAEMSVDLSQTKSSTLRGVIDTGRADTFNKSQFAASSEITVSFNGGSRSLTTGQDQVNVYKIVLTDGNSSLNTSKALQFNIFYEELGDKVNTSLAADLSVWKTGEVVRRYQFERDPAKSHPIYIYPSWAEYNIETRPYPDQTKFDLIQYFNDETNKVRRSYFFPMKQQISNNLTKVPLYTNNKSEVDRINFELTTSEGDVAKNVYCRVDRKFPGGNFKTVFMIKTGSQGKSQSFAEVNEIYYAFTCYKNNEVLDKFPAQLMESPMRLQLGGESTDTTLDYYQKFDTSCNTNNTAVTCDYTSSTEALEEAVLTVERQEVKQDVTVCEESNPTVTGQLQCDGLNASKHYYSYNIQADFGTTTAPGETGFLGQEGKAFPGVGIFMVVIIFMLVTAATAFNLVIGIGSGTLVFLLTSQLNWIVLTPSQKATLIAVAIVAGVSARQ